VIISGIDLNRKPYSFLFHLVSPAKNPLFEVISLHDSMGPPII
jgi:hypothetical protein